MTQAEYAAAFKRDKEKNYGSKRRRKEDADNPFKKAKTKGTRLHNSKNPADAALSDDDEPADHPCKFKLDFDISPSPSTKTTICRPALRGVVVAPL